MKTIGENLMNTHIFKTVDTTLQHQNLKNCKIIRELTEDEADLFDVGMMYKIEMEDGEIVDAFEDELSEIPEVECCIKCNGTFLQCTCGMDKN